VRAVKGRYYVRPVNEGMRRVFSRAFPGKATAPLGADKAGMRQRWVELFCVPPERSEDGTVAAIVDKFMADELTRIDAKTQRPLYAETTRKAYRLASTRIKKTFGEYRYAKTEAEAVSGRFLRSMHLNAYLRENETTRPAAADQEVSFLKSMFACARRWGWAEYNPCVGVEMNGYTPRDVLPSDELFMRVYRVASPTLQCMMDLAQMCGPRRGAIAALTLADDRPEGLRIVANKVRRRQKAKEVIYPWTDDLRAVFERAKAIRQHRRGSGRVESIHLFLTRKGKPYNGSALDRQWRTARLLAGIEAHAFHFHDIRGKSGSESADEIEAMKRLAHADLRTTRRIYRRAPDVVTPLPAVSRKPA